MALHDHDRPMTPPGTRLVTNVIDVDPADLHTAGDAADFHPISDGWLLPGFRLVDHGGTT